MSWVFFFAAEPLPLMDLCRRAVRLALGKERLNEIPTLPLPASLKSYLLYQWPPCPRTESWNQGKVSELTPWAMGSPHSCHRCCWNSSAKVFLPLLQSPCALTGKLSRNPCFTTVLFFGSHFPSTLTKGIFTEALCFPASPEKRLFSSFGL